MPGSNINVNSNSVLAFQGDQTLGGTGTIILGGTGSSNRINVEAGNLTVGSGITIRGENGTIGQQAFVGGAASLTNNGRIAADVSGGTVTLQVNGTVTNNGVLEAQNGGTLVLNNSIVSNAGSHIDVGATSTILQNGVTLQGVISSVGGGSLRPSNNGNNLFDAVNLTGNLDLASSTGIERIVNGFTLNGGIAVNANSVLAFQGDQTVNGNATITLGGTGPSNRVNIEAGNLVLGPNVLIHGENGTIGQQAFVGGASTLTNNGRIAADVSGGTINLQVSGLTTNNGVLEATGGGKLVLSSAIAGTASGSINSGAGSTVLQNGITISGIINTSGSGIFTATNTSNNVFNGVTLNGNLDLASSTGIEVVTGNLKLNGGINVNNNSILAFEGDQTLSGNGTITLGGTGSSNRVTFEAGVLNLASTILIHGENGTIGQQVLLGGPTTLNNAGRISADVAGGSLNLAVQGGVTNNSGTLEARNGGALVLSSAINNVSGGHIDAIGAGSQVVQNGITIAGGTLNTSGGGAIRASNTTNNVLSGVSLAGTLDLASVASAEQIVGGLNLAGGTININANSVLAFTGNQSVTGTGNIVLGSTGSSNRITLEAGDITFGSGVTIHGENGAIGQQIITGGATNLTNNGTIAADVSGGLISLTANSAITNNGTFGASNGATLAIAKGFTGTGTIQTASGGTVTLAGAATQGKLINDGNIALGTNNLTVTSDYSNANFGTGNSFNKRSNVTGTGQILAGGDTSQVVFGSTVTNGSTAAPTLTIGNVHVGATTTNYQIGNGGTAGAAIRGAIETSVNGGNITDARLSGSGVTASNYGPIGTGSNSGNLAVTFTAATAGTLAPLSGQAVHIANNFSNVGEQTLNIALASGAAAYNFAAGSAAPAPIVFANAHVGDARTQAITVTNTAPSGAFTEKLDASFGTNSAT